MFVEVYDKKNNTLPFPYWPWYHPSTHISPRLRLGLIWESRDDTRTNMEKVMYYSLYNKKYFQYDVNGYGFYV